MGEAVSRPLPPPGGYQFTAEEEYAVQLFMQQNENEPRCDLRTSLRDAEPEQWTTLKSE